MRPLSLLYFLAFFFFVKLLPPLGLSTLYPLCVHPTLHAQRQPVLVFSLAEQFNV